MSRTKKRGGTKSPIKKYVSFGGRTGLFSYYDKDKKENVEFESLDIILLDVKSSVTGYIESLGANMSSNLINNSKTEPFKVIAFSKGKVHNIEEGLWADIKPKIGAAGKFTANILALSDLGNGLELVNVQLSGIGLTSWIGLKEKYPNDQLDDYKITIKRGVLSKREGGKVVPVTKKEEDELIAKIKKNPRTPQPVWFYTVEFDVVDLTEEETDLAIAADEELQAYFDGQSVVTPTESTNDTDEDEDAGEENEKPLPF